MGHCRRDARSPTRCAHAACRRACADAARARQCGMTDAPLAEALDTFDLLFAEARSAGEPDPTAMSLATADANGRPSLRTVLLKAHDRRGFVFYTHMDGRKGRELLANPRA